MNYEIQLDFFERLLKNTNIPFQILQEPFLLSDNLTQELMSLLDKDLDSSSTFLNYSSLYKDNCIYRVHDEFLCSYIIFRLPDKEPSSFVFIGPYLVSPVSEKNALIIANRLSIPANFLPKLNEFYRHLPVLSNEDLLLIPINTLGTSLWGSMDNFHLEEVHHSMLDRMEPVASRPSTKEPEEAFFTMKNLEERYAQENNLILAVSQGQTHLAKMYISSVLKQSIENRVANPVRNMKNYLIIMNTLLRKAAEFGDVHPLHIDSLSSRFAYKIEALSSVEAYDALVKEMAHKYCLLVKNHSMKGYSLLVRKVLTRINSDLTADLTLKTQAKLLQVNPSYLSTLFKKETGQTLTEYVNQKRVEHGIFLLNSTDMQIQTIANYCGIPDVNYFIKTFKKLIGKTPKEYRNAIHK